MHRDLFQPNEESEGRILILVACFSRNGRCLEGWTKLAKLDFLLRYPMFLRRALRIQNAPESVINRIPESLDIETKMVRYRYGPWDPAYYAILGRLIGKALIEPIPYSHGVGYRATSLGLSVAEKLCAVSEWQRVRENAIALLRRFDLTGTNLTAFIYEHFPEISGAKWGDAI